jgi:AraC family transcriptional regulator, arabinose operon regulatory protein
MPNVAQDAAYFSTQVTRSRRFYLEAKPAPLVPLVAGGCEWCQPDFIIDRVDFPFFAFEFVAQGRGSVTLGSRSYEVEAGHAFLFDARTPHVIRANSAEPLVKYFFNFRAAKMRRLIIDLGLHAGMVIRVMEAARVELLMEETIDHALKDTPLGLRAAQASIEHALVLSAESRVAAAKQIDPAERTYLRCRGHLVRNYPALKSVEQAAKNCAVSAAYLTRLFQRFDRETPYELLTRLRLTQASAWLRTGDVSAKVVAAELGYTSPAQFSRAFKAFHGVTAASILGQHT